MTHIANYPSKKAFKEAVQTNSSYVFLEDPSFFDPATGYVPEVIQAYEKMNKSVIVTNPKRSWFASVTRKPDGSLKVE